MRLRVPAARRGCFGVGAASDGPPGVGRRGASGLRRAVGVCALAPAACALLRRLSGRLRRAGAGWARLARGSMRPGKALRDDAAQVPHLRLSCPTLVGARAAPRRLQAVCCGGLLRSARGQQWRNRFVARRFSFSSCFPLCTSCMAPPHLARAFPTVGRTRRRQHHRSPCRFMATLCRASPIPTLLLVAPLALWILPVPRQLVQNCGMLLPSAP